MVKNTYQKPVIDIVFFEVKDTVKTTSDIHSPFFTENEIISWLKS